MVSKMQDVEWMGDEYRYRKSYPRREGFVQRGEEEHQRQRFRAEQQGRGTEEEQGGAPPGLSNWREAPRPMVSCGAPRRSTDEA
jgi:hypothetical protein